MVLEKRYCSEHCLSKAFVYSSHELITAKLYAHGVSFNSIKLINNNLLHPQKNSKTYHSQSSQEEILFVVLQDFILGPILHNIFLSGVLIIINDIDFYSYADDSTIHKAYNNVDDVTANLQQTSENLFKWFLYNQMKQNTDKCLFIMSSQDSSEVNNKSK